MGPERGGRAKRLPGLQQGWAKRKRCQASARVNCERRSCHGPFRVKYQAYGAMSGFSQDAALFPRLLLEGRRMVIVSRAHPERGVFFSPDDKPQATAIRE